MQTFLVISFVQPGVARPPTQKAGVRAEFRRLLRTDQHPLGFTGRFGGKSNWTGSTWSNALERKIFITWYEKMNSNQDWNSNLRESHAATGKDHSNPGEIWHDRKRHCANCEEQIKMGLACLAKKGPKQLHNQRWEKLSWYQKEVLPNCIRWAGLCNRQLQQQAPKSFEQQTEHQAQNDTYDCPIENQQTNSYPQQTGTLGCSNLRASGFPTSIFTDFHGWLQQLPKVPASWRSLFRCWKFIFRSEPTIKRGPFRLVLRQCSDMA